MTERDEFKAIDYGNAYSSVAKLAFFFDGCNVLDRDALKKIGLKSMPSETIRSNLSYELVR